MSKYINVDNKVLWKNGIANKYELIKPPKLFSYIEVKAQTPKFVTTKKITELANPPIRTSLNLKFLIKTPIYTAAANEV